MLGLKWKKTNKLKVFYKFKNLIKLFLVLGLGNYLFGTISQVKALNQELLASENKSLLTKKSFVSKAVNRSGPAVVTLETQRTVISKNRSRFPEGIFIDPYFDNFFGFRSQPRAPRSRVERSQGSGVIFTPEGLVLTNAHVVEKTNQLMVGLSNGQRVEGKVVGIDSLTDLAVIRLYGTGPWPTAPLGDSNQLEVGDCAISVGNPFGLENTVTLGIISNLNRNVSQLGISDKRLNLIQTDAAINPGNSGGPLLNSEGEVIGINTLVRSGPGAGLGFAIPINRAREIAKQLITYGRASHPMIGIGLAPATGNDINKSVIVRYIIKGGPGDKGGLKANDIILEVNEDKINTAQEVVDKINNSLNEPLKFKVKRNSNIYFLYITPKDIRSIYR